MNNGDIKLQYDSVSDELFLLKRGVLFGYFILENNEGSFLYKTLEDLKTNNPLVKDSVFIDFL